MAQYYRFLCYANNDGCFFVDSASKTVKIKDTALTAKDGGIFAVQCKNPETGKVEAYAYVPKKKAKLPTFCKVTLFGDFEKARQNAFELGNTFREKIKKPVMKP